MWQRYFGIDVPLSTISDTTIPSTFYPGFDTILTSTEFKFDSTLIGFEFYAVTTGEINITV